MTPRDKPKRIGVGMVPVVPSLDEFAVMRAREAGWPFDPALFAWGATYTPATPASGQDWWQIVQADGPMDIGGNAAIFVDVWDEAGNRLKDVPVLFWNGGEKRVVSQAKPGEPYALDFPMFAAGNAYGARMDDGKPSDAIFGFGMPKFKPHHSFRVIFRLQSGAIVPDPAEPPPRPPGGTDGVRAQYERVRAELDTLGGMLP